MIPILLGKLVGYFLFRGIEWTIGLVPFIWMTAGSLFLLVLSFEPWIWRKKE